VGYTQDGKYLENFEDFEVRGSPVFTQIFQVKTQIFQVVPQIVFFRPKRSKFKKAKIR
jgi:hypothetical protein